MLAAIAPEAEDVQPIFEDKVVFYDSGENWSGVECSACGADAEDWWAEAMDTAFADEFKNLSVKTPCCDAIVSLNDLRYIWPVGFGRFALEAHNPNIGDTSEEQDQRIAESLGNPVRKIWVSI